MLVVLPAIPRPARVPRQVDREHRIDLRIDVAAVPEHLVVRHDVVVRILVDRAARAVRRKVVAGAEVGDRDAERVVIEDVVVIDLIGVDREQQDPRPHRDVADVVERLDEIA